MENCEKLYDIRYFEPELTMPMVTKYDFYQENNLRNEIWSNIWKFYRIKERLQIKESSDAGPTFKLLQATD